jgi:steroid delta-isomerase-like uncharacterized protein
MPDARIEANKALVRRFYEDVWNGWNFDILGEVLTDDIKFHGSLGITASGHRGFISYAETVRAAFPDFHHTVEDMVAEASKLVACMTYRGTHKGPIVGFPATGREIEYAGMALFLFRNGLVSHIWVLGDRLELFQQLGTFDRGYPAEYRTVM